MADVVLAIDPGSMKCGVAVVRRRPPHNRPATAPYETICSSVIETSDLAHTIRQLAGSHHLDMIIIGDGTTSSHAVQIVRDLDIAPVCVIDEKFSTLLARKRFFQENPPRGLRRLIPTSLQTPNTPCDNYVAIILAEKYLDTSP